MTTGRRVTSVGRRWIGVVTALGLTAATAAIAVTLAGPAAAATDLAVGRSASADSAEAGRPAGLANDGNAATRWCAADGNTGHWWQVDLGSAVELTGTQVTWEFARLYRYRVAVSTDGSAWSVVADRANSTSAAQTQGDSFTARARYVRITVTGLAAGTWASISSFSVFGTPGAGVTPPTTPPNTPPAAAQPFKGVAGGSCAEVAKLNVSWHYNWWISPGTCTVPGFVPTVSGKGEKTAGDVAWSLDQLARAGHRTVLGFNEPNKTDQANMSVAQVLSLWPTLTSKPDIRVSSPSTSADGQAWFTDFMTQAAARNLRVDFINLHWYGWNAGSCDANAATFENYIRWAESLPGNKPIWITEFGCMHQSNPNAATVQAFYRAAVAMFARHPRIERYAWYPWNPHSELIGADGQLTPLGRTFAAAPAYR